MKRPLNHRHLSCILGLAMAAPAVLLLARGFAAEKEAPKAPANVPFVNPMVEPGKVRWHKTFAAACTAAKKSGKPVLLFQMMGNLDERFC